MPTNKENKTKQPNKNNIYAIAAVATLMGIGQNGLLISLPVLVEMSGISLPMWSIVIAIGTIMFLPCAPFWGNYSDNHGPKNVVLQALVGYMVSFVLLLSFSYLSHQKILPELFVIGGLILARIIYGCTVSGMVPASQHWAILLCGQDNKLQAITTISSGLSVGRLIGPLLALLALKIHPFAPLIMMSIFPLLALYFTFKIDTPEHKMSTKQGTQKKPFKWPESKLYPLFLIAICLCTAIALMQYSLSPLLSSITQQSTSDVTELMGYLLTLSALVTLIIQVLVVKKKRLTITHLFVIGGASSCLGFMLLLSPNIPLIYLAMVFIAIGAAMLIPAYTTSVIDRSSAGQGSVMGYVAMSHTIGYGFSALLTSLVLISVSVPIMICIALASMCFILSLQQVKYIKDMPPENAAV